MVLGSGWGWTEGPGWKQGGGAGGGHSGGEWTEWRTEGFKAGTWAEFKVEPTGSGEGSDMGFDGPKGSQGGPGVFQGVLFGPFKCEVSSRRVLDVKCIQGPGVGGRSLGW